MPLPNNDSVEAYVGKDTLGELEQQVLLAVLRLGENAYSASIVTELERRTGREVAPAAVYIALRRLEENGVASSRMRPPLEDPGGRPRRYFSVQPAGVALLRESRRRLVSLWEGLDKLLGEGA
jgi:PadR family transcriptional regulator